MLRGMGAKLVVLMLFISLTIVGCSGKQNKNRQENVKNDTETKQVVAGEADPKETNEILGRKTAEQHPETFIQMLENNPLFRSGVLSPDKCYYAYEERSSIILVKLPTAQEYIADKSLAPKVIFLDGIRKGSSFAEMEADYTKRLKQPPLTEEELNKARYSLRSVYKWDIFYSPTFSQDGRYLAYLREKNFGRDRTCTVYIVDLQDNCKLYSLSVKENSEHAEINWQTDNQTLEIYFPWAETVEGGHLALRRQWHLLSDQKRLIYYTNDGTDERKEIALEDAQKAITEFALAEAERNRVVKEWDKLTVEQQVATLTEEQLSEEYVKYFSLHPEQIKLLKERGYNDETIAKMDSYDFQQEEVSWLLSKEIIEGAKRIYPELEGEDLSNWTHQNYNDYIKAQSEENNTPPAALKQEIIQRGLPQDINSGVAKEFHGWENMLAYTNEAIIAMYEARQESEALFRKGEAYRLAVRAAYLREVKG